MRFSPSLPISNSATQMAACSTSQFSSTTLRPSMSFHRRFLPPCFNIRSKSSNNQLRSSSSTSGIRCDDASSSELSRRWIEAADSTFNSREKFTIVSYNILAKRYASKHRDMYLNVPSRYMDWEYRRKVICEELIGWNADIICLQEVDKYFDILKVLEEAGYAGQYKKRAGDLVDGCAVFWKVDRWRLIEGQSIDFKNFDLRDNVAQLSVFEMCNDATKRIVVGNIHVVFRPSRGDVKLGQIRFLLSKAHTLSEKWGNLPVVLAGDFNITPNSAIYKFLSTSKLNVLLHDRRELSGQKNCHPDQVFAIKRALRNPLYLIERYFKHTWTDNELKMATGDAERGVAVHPLKLRSTYSALKGSDSTRDANFEPLATSYHSKFIGTVDYLWYSDGVVPMKVLDTVTIHALRQTGGLPSKEVGSDHLALMAEFGFS